ncbi:unnamed protein product, partial [Ilex paraguariensis]
IFRASKAEISNTCPIIFALRKLMAASVAGSAVVDFKSAGISSPFLCGSFYTNNLLKKLFPAILSDFPIDSSPTQAQLAMPIEELLRFRW